MVQARVRMAIMYDIEGRGWGGGRGWVLFRAERNRGGGRVVYGRRGRDKILGGRLWHHVGGAYMRR